jgi:hypothetical protein
VHDLHPYLHALKRDGNLTLAGAPDRPHAVSAFGLIFGNKSLSGSLIGGIQSTREMLDFCGEHGITSDVEVIPIQKVNEAYERMLESDVKYRSSIDMASLRSERAPSRSRSRFTGPLPEPTSRGAGFVASAGPPDPACRVVRGPARRSNRERRPPPRLRLGARTAAL